MAGTKEAVRTIWQFLALDDAALEAEDVVEMNLATAKEIPGLKELDIRRYCDIVSGWARRFAAWLPEAEKMFHQTPGKWKNDIRFFRVGMLAGFLGHEIGISYKDEQKDAQAVRYTNPSDLFLNGLIDTMQGTCANMAALHVAIARQMCWPVSLAAVKSHFISRYDDGEVCHNIEATDTKPGSFASGSDEDYIKRYELSPKAIASGSDLRRLSAREMLGVFLSLRGRHFSDIGQLTDADRSYALARVLFPTYRRAYVGAMGPMLSRGSALFENGELGHPKSLYEDLAMHYGAGSDGSVTFAQIPLAGVHVVTTRIDANRATSLSPFSTTAVQKEQS